MKQSDIDVIGHSIVVVSLAEFFIRSYCPPDGTVLDPFAGSGTVTAVAERTGRNSIAVDVRESQTDLIRRRLKTVQPELITQ